MAATTCEMDKSGCDSVLVTSLRAGSLDKRMLAGERLCSSASDRRAHRGAPRAVGAGHSNGIGNGESYSSFARRKKVQK